MKKKYRNPEMLVREFDREEIMTTSTLEATPTPSPTAWPEEGPVVSNSKSENPAQGVFN